MSLDPHRASNCFWTKSISAEKTFASVKEPQLENSRLAASKRHTTLTMLQVFFCFYNHLFPLINNLGMYVFGSLFRIPQQRCIHRAANHERWRPARRQNKTHSCRYTPPLALSLSPSRRSALCVWMWWVLTVQAGSLFNAQTATSSLGRGVTLAGRVHSGSVIYGGTHHTHKKQLRR